MIAKAPRRRQLLLPGLLFIGGLILRMWAVNWGLPYVEHPDEPALLEVAVRMAHDGDLNPHRFLYPSLFYYLLLAVIRLHAWWGVSNELYSSITDISIKNNGFTIVPGLFVWTRALSALLGAAAVPALYALGSRMFDRRVGLLSALTLMVATFHVEHSHYVTTDAPTGVWVVLVLLGAWQVATNGRWYGYVFAALAAGLAAGTKYNAGVVVLALVLAHVIFWQRRSLGYPLVRLVAAGGLSLLTFVATTPYAVLDWASFISGLRFNAAHYATIGHGDFTGRWQLLEYSRFLWDRGLFIPASLLALAGIPVLVRRFPRQAALLLTAVCVEMILLLSYAVNFVRNILPIYPLLLLLATAGTVALADLLPRPRARRAVLLLLACALLTPHIYRTAWQLRYWSRPYTMVVAAAAVRELPRGMRIAAEIPETLFGGDVVVFPVTRITDHTLEWYRANGFRYLVVNDDLRSADDRATFEQLRAASRVVREYPRRKLGIQPGPGGAILELPEEAEALPYVRHGLQFEDKLALLGYEIRPGEPRSRITPLDGAAERILEAGQPVQINLYWRALSAIDHDYTLFIHVLNTRDERVTQRDLPLRYDDYPTSRWMPGELVIDRADLALPALPPGDYRLIIGLYDAATGIALGVQGQAEQGASSPTLTTLTIQ